MFVIADRYRLYVKNEGNYLEGKSGASISRDAKFPSRRLREYFSLFLNSHRIKMLSSCEKRKMLKTVVGRGDANDVDLLRSLKLQVSQP